MTSWWQARDPSEHTLSALDDEGRGVKVFYTLGHTDNFLKTHYPFHMSPPTCPPTMHKTIAQKKLEDETEILVLHSNSQSERIFNTN